MKTLVVGIIKFYKLIISPIFVFHFGHACRFKPTCSEYTIDAVGKYGVAKGGLMGIKRVLSCNPFTKYECI